MELLNAILFALAGLLLLLLVMLYLSAPFMLYAIFSRLGETNRLLHELRHRQASPRQPQPRAAAAHAGPANIPPPNFRSL